MMADNQPGPSVIERLLNDPKICCSAGLAAFAVHGWLAAVSVPLRELFLDFNAVMLARACPGHAAHPSAAFGRRCPEGVQLSILACYMPALVLLPPGIEQHTGAGTASARMPEGGGMTRDGRSGHGMNSWALQNLSWHALNTSALHKQPHNTDNAMIRNAPELGTGGTRSCYGCCSCTEANLHDPERQRCCYEKFGDEADSLCPTPGLQEHSWHGDGEHGWRPSGTDGAARRSGLIPGRGCTHDDAGGAGAACRHWPSAHGADDHAPHSCNPHSGLCVGVSTGHGRRRCWRKRRRY